MGDTKTSGEKPAVRIPPPRGGVKVRMFKELGKKVKTVVSIAKRQGKKEDGESGDGAANTSSYSSDGNSDS
ncbi:hypothetical protein SLEP1_g37605 [Rubroshorea leprosula]|uniref:Uncharacterized protein n=1 Tax=Rubroshorea leprosula TaxID=152421 RepID=A0AAV5KVS6_9ROSI|nr:hypothetical protein SLEP1_g37605 [Rubroshorea leprosula]